MAFEEDCTVVNLRLCLLTICERGRLLETVAANCKIMCT